MQKKNIFALVGTSIAAIAICSTVCVAPVSAQPIMASAGTTQSVRFDGHERHPEIQAALASLYQAKDSLNHAAHDFAGHREKALDLVQRAIDECKQAMRADRH